MTHTGIALRYAHALVETLTSPQAGVDPHAALASLRDFVETISQSRDLDLVLLSPSVAPQLKRVVIGKIAGKLEMPRLIRNFLFVLSDHRRLSLVREASALAMDALDEKLGFVRARVSAAAPLSGDQVQRLADQLGELAGRKVRVEIEAAPELIGGVVARVGSTVYDGSVRGQLKAIGGRLAAG